MELTEDDVLPALDNLIDKTLVSTWKASHNRMAKYQHKLHDRVSEKFNFSWPELAVLGVLFLRGAQTVGELRTRSSRLHDFESLESVAEVLRALEEDTDGPYVTLLPRLEGRKESRYAHLFCGEPENIAPKGIVTREGNIGITSRVEALDLEVSELKSRLQAMEQRIESFMKQFE